MMESTRIAIPHELFAPAESSYFSGVYKLAQLQVGPDTYEFSKPIQWEVTISNTGDAFLISGEASAVANTSCARCLVDFDMNIKGEIEGYFLISTESRAPEGMEEDEFDVLPKDNTINVAPLIEAALLLELPLVPLCHEECKGLCSTCGQNLNVESCSCHQNASETIDASENPFAILKDYPFEDS